MTKKINIQNDVESRQRIACALPQQEPVKKEVINAQSKEVPEHPVIETGMAPDVPKKGRRKAEGNA